jgi:gluconate kinase
MNDTAATAKMGKKRFISCCSLIEPTRETVKPNLTGEASFFGTLIIFLEASAYFAARRSRQRVGTMFAIIAF